MRALVIVVDANVTEQKQELIARALFGLIIGAVIVSIFIYPEYYVGRMAFLMFNIKYILIGFISLVVLEKISSKLGGKYAKVLNYCSITFLLIFLLGPFQYI